MKKKSKDNVIELVDFATRYRDVVDEYYAFVNDYPESKYLKEAQKIFNDAENIVKKKNISLEED